MVLCPKSHRKNTPESTQFCLMLLLSQPNSVWRRPCAWFPKGFRRVRKSWATRTERVPHMLFAQETLRTQGRMELESDYKAEAQHPTIICCVCLLASQFPNL